MTKHIGIHASKYGLMFAVLLIVPGATNTYAEHFVVTNTTDGPSPGPAGSLRAAIHAANTNVGNDTVSFESSLFSTPQTIVLASELPILDSLAILGPGANRLTISGNQATRVMLVEAGVSAVINHLKIENGNVDPGKGGGIFSRGTLTLNQIAIVNCRAREGGGVFSDSGTLIMNNCELSQNYATLLGGGLGVYARPGSSNVLLTNVTISGNSTGSQFTGAGIDLFSSQGLLSASLVNCTVAHNANGFSGGVGGIFVGGGIGAAQLTLKNTIVAANTGSQLYVSGIGEIVSNGSNLISDDTLPTPLPTDMINTPALLRPLALNGGTTRTHALQWESPAIDSGSNTAPPATDQRGRARRVAAICDGPERVDRGAFEVQKFVVSTLAEDGEGSLRWAVEDNNADGGGVICLELPGIIHQASGALNLLKDVTILGPGADRLTLNAMAIDRHFMIPGGVHAVICDLTLTGGRRPNDGGGVAYIEGGSLDIRRCAIIYSYASQGGGILNSNGTLNVSECEISFNTATLYGGGILTLSQGLPTTTTLVNTTISGNHCEGINGTSGGIFAYGGAAEHFLSIRNCTFADNTGATAATAGALTVWGAGGACTAEIGNTIIAGAGPQIVVANATLQSLGHNLCSDTHPSLNAATDLLSTDPLLGPLFNNGGGLWSHAIGIGSPALDAGGDPNTDIPPTDQHGRDRVRGCAMDIGAFEFQSGDPGSGDFDGSGIGVSDTAAFVQTLLDPTGGPSCIADLNGDQSVDGLDIQEFVYAVFGL